MTVEDLSSIFARNGGDPITAIAPTSQSAVGQSSSNELARTAPGSEPSTDLRTTNNEIPVHDAPQIHAEAYNGPVLLDPSGADVSPDNADRGNPFSRPDGAGWRSGADTATPLPGLTRRTMVRRGEWNEI